MADAPSTRSVKIGDDERRAWSSDPPRRDGRPRPPNISVRCRVLRPSDRLRYSPGSLLVIVSASKAERDDFVNRVIDDRPSLFSLDKVRALLVGRVPEEEVDARAAEVLEAAVLKRLEASETVVLAAEGLEAAEREPFVRAAARIRRPRHIILLETSRDQVQEEDRATLNELRRALEAGELGAEGFQTALRLGGESVRELKGIAFEPESRDD